jgi:2-dehydro-3-deoxyglucarate aldolase/4-hydroxy-2-oxoheptanedioate aldolase
MTSSKLQLGTWLSTGSPAIAELAALCGFDWLLLDLEHGCEPEAALPDQLRALGGRATQPIVRVGAPYPDQISRVLDWGAKGVMVPHVESAEEARAIVSAAYYAPRGKRGLSRTVRTHGYGLTFSSDAAPRIMAQIESVEGVKNVEAIAAVDGIDVLFVGPADLNHDLEHHPEWNLTDFDACLTAVVNASQKYGKAAGILCRDVNSIKTFAAQGFTEIAVESDLGILRQAYKNILTTARL